MSEPTDAPQKQGQRRRRRGGRNRNNSQSNHNNQSNHSQGSKGQQGRSNRSGGNSGGRRRSRNRGPRKPIKLSWWEKLLVVVGLKEDPNKRTGKPGTKKAAKQAPKSNTRNARSKDDGNRPKAGSGRKLGERGSRDKRRRGGDASTVESGRVYVGNLSYDVTEEDLKELFKGIGTVRRVEIVYNRNTHRSKGYGFVEMMNKDDAIRSVEVLDDQPFMGRNMNVSGAKDKSESNDPDELEPEMQVNASEIDLAPIPQKTEEKVPKEATIDEPATVDPTEASAESETVALPTKQPEETVISDSDEPVTNAVESIAEVPAPIQQAAMEVTPVEITDTPEEATLKAPESPQEEEPKQS